MKRLLYVGKLSQGKGADLFVEAVGLVRERGVIIGEGPLRSELEARAWALGIWGLVEFMGAIGHRYLGGYYRHADVTVVPSRWQEPFGRVALEALWYGCPIVVTPRGGLPEIARYGQSVVAAQPEGWAIADATLEILSQPRRGPDRETLRRVFGEEVRDAYLGLYRELL